MSIRYNGEEYHRNPFNMNRGLNGETTTWEDKLLGEYKVYEMQTSENSQLRDEYLSQVKSLYPVN